MNTAFVARMEDVLAIYERPHDPLFPVACFNERPCVAQRNAARATGHWQFMLTKARTKLDRHYQKIKITNSPD